MKYIIQLRDPAKGVRYYMSRGKHIAYQIEKAKVFDDEESALDVMNECTLWEDRCLLMIEDQPLKS